jgi:hypothetical protein
MHHAVDGALLSSAMTYALNWRKGDPDRPDVLFEMVASGDALIKSATAGPLRAALDHCPKIAAVEMEGAGVAKAVEYHNATRENVGLCMIRGISDLVQAMKPLESPSGGDSGGGDESRHRGDKNSDEREASKSRAATNAARFAVDWIKNGWPAEPGGRKTPPADTAAYRAVWESREIAMALGAANAVGQAGASALGWAWQRAEDALRQFGFLSGPAAARARPPPRSDFRAGSACPFYDLRAAVMEQHVFYRGPNGTLNQTWWDGERWRSRVIPGAPVSDPIAMAYYASAAPELHVYFRDVTGRLVHTWSTLDFSQAEAGLCAWATEVLGASAAGDPFPPPIAAGAYQRAQQHVFYVEDGRLHQVWSDRLSHSGWCIEELPGFPCTQPPFGLTTITWQADGHAPLEQHVYYVGASGALEQSWFTGREWLHQVLPARPAGGPAAMANDDHGALQHVLYVTAEQKLEQSFWDGSRWVVQGLPGAPSDARVFALATRGEAGSIEEHAFYVGRGGVLGHSWWNGRSWTGEILPDRPARLLGVCNAISQPDGRHAQPHVFFHADDGALYLTRWNGRDWESISLPTATVPDTRGR